MIILKKHIFKNILIAAVILALFGAFLYKSHTALYIPEEEALAIAAQDAGLSSEEIYDVDVEFERHRSEAWYEIEFDSAKGQYECMMDARSGEILFSLC